MYVWTATMYRRRAMRKTKVQVKVVYEVEYEGKVTEEDIDLNDVLRDMDAIKEIDVDIK